MLQQLAQSACVIGTAIGVAIGAPAVQAQLVVTGGSIAFQGTQIYVPNINNSNLGAIIYNGSGAVVVRTSGISINDNVLLRGGILPTLNTCACTTPQVGDMGKWLPTLSFVAYSQTGEPTVFRNIPAELNFRVDSLVPTGFDSSINRYESFPFLLTQTGRAVNASSFGGVQRTTPVVFVEFGQSPSSSLQSIGISNVTPGINYPSDIKATITGGIVSAPLANSFSGINNPPPNTGAPNKGDNGSFFISASTYVGAFNSVTTIVSVYGPGSGSNQADVTDDTVTDRDPGRDDGDQGGDDDEDTIFVDKGTNTRYVVVGVPSRVFPGMIGVEGIRETKRTARKPDVAPVPVSQTSQLPTVASEIAASETVSETGAIAVK